MGFNDMLFECSIIIPKETPSTTPTEEILRITNGIINKFSVCPRPGHAGLAHCVILYREHQIAPSTEGMEMHGDTFPIEWSEEITIDQPPYELKILGWNEDDTYEHTFDIYVSMTEAPEPETESTLVTGLKGLLKMVGIGT